MSLNNRHANSLPELPKVRPVSQFSAPIKSSEAANYTSGVQK